MNSEKQLFNWISRSGADPEAPLIDNLALRFYTALIAGEDLRRLNRMRGIIQACGCNFRGFQEVFTPMLMRRKLTDACGQSVVVPGISFHLVTCHRSKLDNEERDFLGHLPEAKAFTAEEVERLRRIATDGAYAQ